MKKWLSFCLCIFAVACSSSTDPAASGEIDDQGGTVEVTTGALAGTQIVIPAGALGNPTQITITAGASFIAGQGVPVGPAVQAAPAGTNFAVPVTVTLPFNAGQAGAQAVMVAQRDAAGTITIHNMPMINGGLASVTVTSFSTFEPFVETLPATFDMTGQWVACLTNWFSNPPGLEEVDSFALIDVTQTDNAVTAVPQDGGGTFTGTVSAADYAVSKTTVEPDGTETENLDFTLSDMDTGAGTLSWTFQNGVMESGGATLMLSRQMPAMFTIDGTWDVTISNNFSIPAGNEDDDEVVPIPVTQNGLSFTLESDSGVQTGFVSGASYYASWEEDAGGGEFREIYVEFTLTSATAGTGTIRWLQENGSVIRGGADLSLAKQ